MIDLSHLTEEEQAKILRVLQRDAELRKMEETRICQLQISNEIQRKNMTGEWFYKAKARRHKDTLHGAELIAASMRRKKPKTIYERLQMKEAKENSNSFSKNAAGDIFIPPELSLFLEEPKNSAVSQKENATQWQQQMAKKNPPSLGKQRENPFNKSFSSTDYPNEQERLPLSIGKQSTSVTSMQESLSHPKDNVSRLYFPTNEHSPAENNSETRPVPKPRTISSKLQVPSDNLSDASGSKNWNGLYNNSSTPKSILKRSPSSSSNDSEILRIGVQDSRNKVPASQTIPEGVTELNEAMANEESLASNNLEKLKQVRFSTNVDEKRISQIQEHYDANELSKIGEDSILDTDYMEEMDEEDTAGVDIMEENETLPEDSGFSDLRHLPLELQTDFMHLNQEVNSMSNTDFQSIQATDSNPQNYSDSYLPHSSSSKLTNQIHELDTGEMPMEKKSSRRSNSPSNSSYYSIDEQIPHTDFASSWVSDQQLPEIIEGDDEITHVVRRRNPQTKDTYKSLEDLNSIDSMPSTLDSKNKEVVLSADDVSNIPVSPENTPLHLKKLKRLSQSVPALAENGDTDSMSERSYQMNKHGTITGSLTNISSSPGMTSRSSVSGSIMSIYSNEFGNIDVRGKIQFSLDYVDKLKEFHIFVVRCSDLAAADEKKNRSDPYVKSYLLPDKVKLGKKKTTVKKKTLSPVYNEILRYKVEKNVLLAQTLNLSVWHNDTFGRNNFLGEVDIELEKWDWSNKQMEWYNLKPRTITSYTSDNKGTLRVAFRYIPQGHKGKKTGEVQIWVKEATNLPQIRAHRLDPFVKCFILPDTTRKSRQKTRVVKKSRNPNFNHTMVYDGFEPEDLKDACVELSVWDHDKLVNHFLGGIRIGLGTGKSYGLAVDWMDSTEEEKQVWNKMITHPNIWVENVLPLRMLMLSKSTTN
ncbi:synaptotagmin-like protein 2 isoform X5 [Hypanus sabinus]|uniref:synaptotagmin-like protein 2 isoform X5 n=1 Tax=Hypanus sabinus TaxID=79690 RepID=UPI0028C4F8CF|nr:synaptotagmin-like protein 2 isoform X5 [Hypanus sabinus]